MLEGKLDANWTSVLFSVKVITCVILLLGSVALVIVCVIVSPDNQVPLKVTFTFFFVLVLAITNVVTVVEPPPWISLSTRPGFNFWFVVFEFSGL